MMLWREYVSSQEKKSLFDLYPRMMERIVNEMKQSMPSKERKSMTPKQMIKVLIEYSPELLHSLDFLIMAEEFFWERNGSNAIFPESSAVLDNLMRAKYQMDSSEGFALPFDSFFMALPHGYSYNGVRLESFMVTMVPYLRSQDYTIFPFCDHYGIPRPKGVRHDESPENARCISITYRDPENKSAYLRALQTEDKLPLILKCETADEFGKVIGNYHGKVGVIGLNDNELKVQFTAMKLVAALGVYNMATKGDRLAPGFPGKQEPKIHNRDRDSKFFYSTLKNAIPTERTEVIKDAFYRTWHFRQLRDERYYRGEHENQPRGSRYSFVSDTVVGQKVSPHTQSVSGEKPAKYDVNLPTDDQGQ